MIPPRAHEVPAAERFGAVTEREVEEQAGAVQ